MGWPLTVLEHEQPLPARAEGHSMLTERFTLEGPKGTLVILAPGQRASKGLGGEGSRGAASITLDDSGKAEFELEVTW